MNAYELLRDAIANQYQVSLFYDGFYRECCPHVIGKKGEVRHVLVFQFAGGSKGGLPLGGDWRCMNVDAIFGVEVREGPWHSQPHTRPQTCIDRIDTEVQAY